MKIKEWIPGRTWLTQHGRQQKARRLFREEFEQYRALVADQRHSVEWEDRYPCLDDRTANTGFDRHYVYHTGWALRILALLRPEKHIDIASSLFFVAAASALMPVEFYDYRPAQLGLDNVTSHPGTLTDLSFPDQSVDSLSCMHVVEHVGLGRYGDPIDPQGDQKALAELQRVVSPGGSLLFVTPVGHPRVCFNAHRIYSFEQVIDSFPELTLEQFAMVPDEPAEGGLVVDADPERVKTQTYACGCFWLRRKS